ncbi:hypothetical protein D3C86_1899170 [compost metagenome]
MAQPCIGLFAVGFRGLDQAVKLGADQRALRRVAKQPALSTDDERPDRTFGAVVIDRQVTLLDIPRKFVPVARQVTDGFSQGILSRDLRLRLFHPAF